MTMSDEPKGGGDRQQPRSMMSLIVSVIANDFRDALSPCWQQNDEASESRTKASNATHNTASTAHLTLFQFGIETEASLSSLFTFSFSFFALRLDVWRRVRATSICGGWRLMTKRCIVRNIRASL